jgi:isoleucyl-tRNA synthetase
MFPHPKKTCLRDRLYCEPPNSAAHDAALWTLDVVGRTLIQTIASIMPHLAVEFFTHHPTLSADPELAFRQCFDADGQPLKDTQVQRMIGNREQLQELMELLRLGKSQVADQLQHVITSNPDFHSNLIKSIQRSGKEMEDAGLCLQISGTAQQMSLLGAIHPPGNLPYSELVELFSCAFVRLNWEEPTSEFRVQLLDPLSEGLDWCSRCRKRNNQRARKKTAEEESELCERCEHAVEELVAMEVGRMDVKKDINSSGSAASTPIVPSSSAGA